MSWIVRSEPRNNNQLVPSGTSYGKKKSILTAILEFFGFGDKDVEVIPVVEVDPRVEYVRKSVKRVHVLSDVIKCDEFILDESVTLEQSQVLNDILKITKEVHTRIEKDINIIPQKLEQFHMYYTDNLLNLLSTLKHSRVEIRDVPVNPEPYIRKAVSYKDTLIQNAVRLYEKGMMERYGDVVGNRMIRQERDEFIANLDRRIFFIKQSKESERSPIFYAMDHLYKVYVEGGEYKTTKLIANEGFQKRIQDAKDAGVDNFANIKMFKEKSLNVNFFSLTQEQYTLLVEYKEKIEDYYINIDNKKEKVRLEMDNLKSILNTDMLDF